MTTQITGGTEVEYEEIPYRDVRIQLGDKIVKKATGEIFILRQKIVHSSEA